ncbi:MAG: M10 family metallopeptidase C-terminal domain-containing protein, partial [Planctomycetaceae bacterium]
MLKAGTVLNFESKSSYNVTVDVDDSAVGGGAIDASQTFTLTITDVNEAPTSVTLQNTTTSLNENTSTATSIKLADIVVTDDALGTNDLSLSGSDAVFFEISGSNELMLKAGTVLDFETKSSYNVTVDVDDSAVGGGAVDASQNFTLTITDANEAPTAVALQNTTSSLAENASTVSAIKLADIVVTDDALGTNDLTLSGTDSAFFEISGSNELMLKAGTVLNFESKSSYNVTVEVDDSAVGGGAIDASQAFTLTITDVNEAPTSVTLQNTTTSLNENASTATSIKLADIVVTDDALGINDLSLSGTDAAFFEISGSNELMLKAGTVLDFETKSSYNVTLDVDGAGVGINPDASAAFTLTLENLLDTTSGDDAFVFTYSALAVDVTHAINGGLPVLIGKFPLTAPITLDGLSGNDSVRIVGTSGDDAILVQSTGLTINGAGLILNGFPQITLAGEAGNDTYTFDTDASLSTYTLEDSAGTSDTISMAPTSGLPVMLDLSQTTAQSVNAHLSLILGSATDFENATGGDQDDVLSGNSSNNRLTGNGGRDRLNGRDGSDEMIGGQGDDTYVFGLATSSEADTVNEATNGGTDTLDFSAQTTAVTAYLNLTSVQTVHTNRTLQLNSHSTVENLIGGSGSDLLVGNGLNNTLTGNAGDDTLNGTTGSDMLIGGLNNDIYTFGTSSVGEADQVVENTGEGVDTLSFATRTTTVTVYLHSTAVQTVHTNRTLQLSSHSTIENLIGGSGSDLLVGNALNNTLTGGAGDDILNGTIGSDLLFGGLDNDVYTFGTASVAEVDQVFENTSEGIDTLSFATQTISVTLSLNSTAVQPVHASRSLQLNSINDFENLVGGSASDVLVGNTMDNTLTGGAGDDLLNGTTGSDLLIGGLDNDVYTFGAASVGEADRVVENAGEGVDTISFSTQTQGVTVYLNTAAVQLVHANRTLQLNSINDFENLTGGSGADVLVG